MSSNYYVYIKVCQSISRSIPFSTSTDLHLFLFNIYLYYAFILTSIFYNMSIYSQIYPSLYLHNIDLYLYLSLFNMFLTIHTYNELYKYDLTLKQQYFYFYANSDNLNFPLSDDPASPFKYFVLKNDSKNIHSTRIHLKRRKQHKCSP